MIGYFIVSSWPAIDKLDFFINISTGWVDDPSIVGIHHTLEGCWLVDRERDGVYIK
jgi:hypothetical protein